ncbi:STAS domain-containing protein [Streptomyces sp. AC563]|uniref:STAS domain-containing protein n=1 Tax=Streptomyces buecherae TaxID=2763006 RepID=UPI00164EAED9|nr:STAS domain-containing protein [Streptomyces buecherae]MBC3993864.1 STAS domain-containing protein [Streptomyces buecherae]
MTPLPPTLRLATVEAEDSVRIEITGDLDYDSAGLLLEEATARLGARSGLDSLRLSFTQVGVVDSTGLSALLMIHRRATAAGVRLHLDDRPPRLDRILTITGTLEHFTAPPPAGATAPHQIPASPLAATEAETTAARPTGPHSST